jgi:hypothetical protein
MERVTDVRADTQADVRAELDSKGSDRNADKDRGPDGVQRRGLGLVDTRITWMRTEVQAGPEGASSDL